MTNNRQYGDDDTGQRAAEDRRLVLAALEDEQAAFAQLVERYMPTVYAVGWSEFHERERAEELAQEVFLRAFLGLKDLQRPDFFPVWIHRIARNLASTWKRNGWRKSKLVQMVPLEERTVEIPDERTPSGAERLAMQQEDAALREAVIRLPEDLRQVVLMHFSDELSLSEIGRRLGLAPSSASRRLERALALLRADLGEGGSADKTVERARGTFRAPRQVAARTVAMVGAASLLAAEAKAALLATAAATHGGIAAGVTMAEIAEAASVSSASAQAGGWGLATTGGKFIAGAAVAALVVGGGLKAFSVWPLSPPQKALAPAPLVARETKQPSPPAAVEQPVANTSPVSTPAPVASPPPETKAVGSTPAIVESKSDSVLLPVQVKWDGGQPIAGAEVRCSTLLDHVTENGETVTRESARNITTLTADGEGSVTFSLPKRTARVRLDANFPDAVRSGKEVSVDTGDLVVLTLRPGRRVFGKVYKEEAGQRIPVAGATVTLAADGAPKVVSGPDGSYTLTGIAGKQAEVIAILDTLRAPASREERHLVQLAGRDNGPVDLVLRPSASLVGAVISRETNEPVAGARVTAFAGLNRQTHLETQPSDQDKTTRTDKNGAFVFEGLPKGPQKLKVLADGYGDLVKTVDLAEGDENKVVLALEGGGEIVVNAIDRDGLPVEGATLNVARENGWYLASRTNRDGIVVLPGVDWDVPHTLWVWKHSTKSKVETVVLKRGEVNTSVTLEFAFSTAENEAPGVIVGTVKDEAGQPIENATLYAQQAWAVSRDTTGDRYVTNALGEFRMERRGANGEYYISVSGEGWAPDWAKAKYGTATEPQRVNFVLERGNSLEGKVVDPNGAPMSGVTVRPYLMGGGIISVDGHPGMRETTTDADGNFRLKNLPGPQVTVGLRKPGWMMPGGQRPIADVNRSVKLTMIRAGEIAGRVVQAGGKAVTAFVTRLRPSEGFDPAKEQQFFDDNGRFLISDLEPGRSYELTILPVIDTQTTLTKTVRAREVGSETSSEEVLVVD